MADLIISSMITLLGTVSGASSKSLPEKVTRLKAKLNEAYALILDEKKVLLDDDVLQDQVDLLTRLCYDAEDVVIKFESWMTLKALAWSRVKKSIGVDDLEKQLLSMATRLGNAISSLPINPLQTPSSLKHNQRFHFCHGKREPLVGRDEDIDAIIWELTSRDENKTSGFSIVGMNGVGKSALVKEILNHRAVIESYELILRASLSGPFNSEEISKQLLESYKEANYGSHCNYTDMYQRLHERRWLIALDNLSDVAYAEWSDFQSLFYPSREGKFLITTVNHDIPVVTQTTRYCLHPLSDEYCRDVILSKAKTGINDDRNLSPVIDILAEKCSGLPLVANFMGFLLHDENKRRTMLDGDLWEVSEFQSEILPTLTSTYSMLEPRHLRKCFAYFSLFPHNFKRYKMEDLIHLWIGEGFIQCHKESNLEQVGEDYFKTLVKWSILQPSGVELDGKPCYYIHKFTHKLAKLVASDTCFCLDGTYSRTLAVNARHLSLSCQNLKQDYIKKIKKLKGLRTLLQLDCGSEIHCLFPGSLFKKLLYIRVLSFQNTDVAEVPESICELKFLRYLDISDTNISRLPGKISKLHNLLILKLKHTKLEELPEKFNKLIKLRYIDWEISETTSLSLPSSIGNLTCLQGLPLFEVGNQKGYSIIELRDMVNLQGSICIKNLENVKKRADAAKAELYSKKLLEKIEFQWATPSQDNIGNAESVLSALRPHDFLRKLRITNYSGREFPAWLGELLLLEAVDLTGCSCRILPALGHLAALKFLRIDNMMHVVTLNELFHKSSSSPWFPALESLILRNLPRLTRLPSLEQLTSLKNLQIVDCGALISPELPPTVKKFTVGPDTRVPAEENQPLATHESVVDRIPTAMIDGQLKPISDDPSIEVLDKSTESENEPTSESENEPTSDKCSQLRDNLLLHEFPSHMEMMRHCLLFPKDYKFAKRRLIHLWSAAGFLKNMEDDGDRFFHLLLDNGFIVAPANEDLGGTEIYQSNLTEAVKHLDEKVENVSVIANEFGDYSDVSVTSGEIDQKSFESFRKFSKLRSLLFLNGSVTAVPSHIFSAFNFLTTLDLSRTGIKELPTSVRYAKELRYLDLSWTLIEKLPDSIADLFELQYLKLEGCTHLFSLPERMKQLSKLRHLDFDVLGQLTSMPEGIGALVELQTLWAFIVGSTDGYSIRELKNMENLCGKFCLSGLENVLKVEDAREAALNEKPHLLQLELRWSSIFKKIKKCNYVEVLEGLEPDTHLNDLQIKCFPGSNFPKWVGDRSYSNLVSIVLYKCEHCKLLPSLGELSALESLELIDMNGVTKIDEGKPFPELKTLTIDGMKSLKKWSGLNGVNFPSIVNLTIKQCPKLSTLKLSLPPSDNSRSSASLPCSHVEIVNCPKLARLPDRLLSSSLQTLIIEDCPLGHRYGEGGKDRDKINRDAKVWIFQGTPSDEEIPYTGTPQTINE